MDTALKELIDMIKSASPYLWAMAQERAQAEIRGEIFNLVFVVFITVLLGFILLACLKVYSESDYDDGLLPILGIVLAGGGIIFCVILIGVGAHWLIVNTASPDYLALKMLAELATGSK